jgi:hypothetical protein
MLYWSLFLHVRGTLKHPIGGGGGSHVAHNVQPKAAIKAINALLALMTYNFRA